VNRILYKHRPCYGTDKFLIEILSGIDEPEFIATFMNAINAVNPMITGAVDLWMNDEVQFEFRSEAGAFTLSKDIWGFVFVEANNNQECLKKLDALLSSSTSFERLAINPEDYK